MQVWWWHFHGQETASSIPRHHLTPPLPAGWFGKSPLLDTMRKRQRNELPSENLDSKYSEMTANQLAFTLIYISGIAYWKCSCLVSSFPPAFYMWNRSSLPLLPVVCVLAIVLWWQEPFFAVEYHQPDAARLWNCHCEHSRCTVTRCGTLMSGISEVYKVGWDSKPPCLRSLLDSNWRNNQQVLFDAWVLGDTLFKNAPSPQKIKFLSLFWFSPIVSTPALGLSFP